MILSAHQPQYLPWPGYFGKICKSNIFIILDDVQYQKNGLQNRNQLIQRKNQELHWLTVPVEKGKKLIHKTKIVNDFWKKKHLNFIRQNYSDTPHFKDLIQDFENIIHKKFIYINELNTEIIKWINLKLNIDTKIFFSSNYQLDNDPNLRIIKLCQKFKCETYLSGIGGKSYLNLELFKKNGIKVDFYEYKSAQYTDNTFKSKSCSILDMMFYLKDWQIRKILNETN